MEAAQPTTPVSASELRANPAQLSEPGQRLSPGPADSTQAGVTWDRADDGADHEQTAAHVMKLAAEAFAKTGSWVVFFRDMLGRGGVVQEAFPTAESMAWFLASPQHSELQEMIAALRSNDTSKGGAVEPEKMITIRLPKSLHDVLTDESEAIDLSINKLCISKLLQPIDSRCVPVQQGKRRGRKPGPQGPRKKADEAPQMDGAATMKSNVDTVAG